MTKWDGRTVSNGTGGTPVRSWYESLWSPEGHKEQSSYQQYNVLKNKIIGTGTGVPEMASQHIGQLNSLKSGTVREVNDIIQYRMQIGGVMFELTVDKVFGSEALQVTLMEPVLGHSSSRQVSEVDVAAVGGSIDAAINRIFSDMLTELAVFAKLQRT